MKKILGLLICLLLGVNLLQTSSLFCSRNVNLTLAEISEHDNMLLNQEKLSLNSIIFYLKAANQKYETNFTDNTFHSQKDIKNLKDLVIETNIYHYYLVFLLIKSLLTILIAITIIKQIRINNNDLPITKTDFGLISFLAIYQPTHIYIHNCSKIPFSYGIAAIIFVYLWFLAIYYILNKSFRNKVDSLIISVLVTILLYNYFELLHRLHNLTNVVIACSAILFVTILLKNQLKKSLAKTISITLIALLFINFIFLSAQFVYRQNTKNNTTTEELPIIENSTNKNRDIYIIILDMYSGTNILQQKFQFDNHEFIKALKSEGFYVYDHMYSNYNFTYAIIPSLYNFNYLENTEFTDSSQAINNSLLFKIAKHNKYHIYYLNSWYFTINDNLIDKIYNAQTSMIPDIKNIFFGNSMMNSAIATFNISSQNNPNKFITDTIKDNNKSKKFVIFHILTPHWPYLYDENGNSTSKDIQMDLEKGYLGYLKYTNKETLKLIKQIRANSKEDPVIIITGDHGLRDDRVLESQFSTFTAYYNPERAYTPINQTRTLLNFFIKAMNYEFGLNIEQKPDKINDVYHVTEVNENQIIKKINLGKDVTKILKK